MEHGFSKRANKMFETRRKRKIKNRVILGVGGLVTLLTFQIMMLPALTLTDKVLACEQEEHVHSDACNKTILVCEEGSEEGHSHSAGCYEVSYVCGETESEGHSHNSGCYSVVCGQEDDPDHEHTDACKELTCGKEEAAGHSHSDACKDLTFICGQEEREAVESNHIHGPKCYETYRACGLEEHTHVESCYKVVDKEDNSADDTEGPAEEENAQEPNQKEVSVEIPDYIYDDVLGMGHGYSTLSLESDKPADYSENLILTNRVAKTENGYTLTLEAFAQGELATVSVEKPLDTVVLLDQSDAMFEPAMPSAGEIEIYAEMTEKEWEEAVVEAGLITRDIFLELVDTEEFVTERTVLRGYFLGRGNDTWYLIQYDADEENWLLWERGDEDPASYSELPEDIEQFYVSRYGKMYDAVIALADGLSASEAGHRMALVGMEESKAVLLGEDAEDAAALIDLNEEYGRFCEAIDSIVVGQGNACLSAGFEMANSIFEAADEEACGTERARAVILITGENAETPDEEIVAAVDASYDTKNTYGATVYAVTMGDSEDDFRQYLSSAYPEAQTESIENEEIEEVEEIKMWQEESTEEQPAEEASEEDEKTSALEIVNVSEENMSDGFEYYVVLETAGDLYECLEEIGVNAASGTAEVDETAVLRAVLSEYFAMAEGNIKVSVAPYLGNDTFGEAVETELQVRVSSSVEGEERMDIVEISGFDFADELLGEPVALSEENVESTEEADVEQSAEGHKLIVEIPLVVREGFWGGNGVAVLAEESGIYVAGGIQNILDMESPETDVELSLAISEEQIAYVCYLQPIDMAKLIDVVSRGKLITYDGTDFVPAEEWMDDFAKIEWLYCPENISNVENSEGHQFVVRMIPKDLGDAAAIMLADIDSESETVGVTKQTALSVCVVKPLFTFRDAVISLGQKPNEEGFYYGTHKVLSEKVLGYDSDKNAVVENVSFTLDDFKFEYTPRVETTEEPFIFDTPIDVKVYMNTGDETTEDITSSVYFQQANCNLEMHTDEKETFEMHAGNVDMAEFVVHVQSGIELPDTGGIGTTIFYALGGLLVVGALILLVTKKRMNKTEEEDLDITLDDEDL